MSHSKRNTSLAFFTAHERSEVAKHWGSKSTRLTRDTFLPFGSCQLCLLPARDPVSCPGHGHLFCRECTLSNLLAQGKELKRLNKEAERRWAQDEEEQEVRVAEAQARAVEEFERLQAGLEVKSSDGRPSSLPHYKKPNLNAIKKRPTCPAAAADAPHEFMLKSLVTVHFTEEKSADALSDAPVHTCPSCNKPLSNSTKAILARPCGHVVCKPCSDRFQKPPEKSAHEAEHDETVRCYVCREDVTAGRKVKKRKRDDGEGGEKEGKEKGERGLVELSSDGTGFAGGGKNIVKKHGVAFQC